MYMYFLFVRECIMQTFHCSWVFFFPMSIFCVLILNGENNYNSSHQQIWLGEHVRLIDSLGTLTDGLYYPVQPISQVHQSGPQTS